MGCQRLPNCPVLGFHSSANSTAGASLGLFWVVPPAARAAASAWRAASAWERRYSLGAAHCQCGLAWLRSISSVV